MQLRIEAAKKGDDKARAWLSSYLVGVPKDTAIALSRLDEKEQESKLQAKRMEIHARKTRAELAMEENHTEILEGLFQSPFKPQKNGR